MLIFFGFVLIVALTAATGYFVAQEFAYVAVDRAKLRQLADGGDEPARRALRVTGRLSFMLSGAQLGITVTALLVGFVAEPYLGAGLANLLDTAGVPTAVSLPLSVAAALLFATVVQMVLGELAPKNLAIARPETLARALGRSTLAYLAVAGPVIRLFDVAATRLLRRIGVEPVEELPTGATAEELERIVADARAGGHLDDETSRLLARGLEFRQHTAGQVMTPRVDVHTVRVDEPATRVVDLLDTGHSRFPVLGDHSVDDIVGVIGINDVLALSPAERAATPVARVATPALLLPESLPLPAVLDRLRGEHRQLACVLDEYGAFAGVITLEDIAEELVGQILDEDDPAEPGVLRRPDGAWLVPGRWRVDEVADATGVQLPEGEHYDTIAGLVMTLLGRVPQPGDRAEVTLPATGDDATPRVTLEVVAVARHVPASIAVIAGADEAVAA
ncbi:HlyC/CorC family transporter [Planosporangium flavigriseum]|uniref:Membrane protein n=1 Tax=Planosporangium flavigriseum TaxID=373681 RepID=A0A8J3PQW4_9ACTN|nr:hemolysin family protein [Planosporangium flavigriseum]NJC65663.1 HlyC/CorC family transporter [Planosporangium flavigriseum]GIG76526.1 membrane protein [Planosporangium flavigriseum]